MPELVFAAAIIDRELRVRSRRPVTVWLRVGVGVAGSLMAISQLNLFTQGFGSVAAGKWMFLMLAWTAFGFCILEGARCGADVISREKREGTLGFLLLTRMSGFEVALGKLVAVSLASFYALLSVVPAMAIALAAGGLTAGEFWRTQAVLLNTLFLAVAAGIWVSARSRDEMRALLGSLALLATIVILPEILQLHPAVKQWPSLSPGVLLGLADASRFAVAPKQFWASFMTVNALAWALLILAGRQISSGLTSESPAQQKDEPDPSPWRYTIPPSLHGDPRRAAKKSQRLLEVHPIRWLSLHRAESRALIWLALLLPPAAQVGFNLLLKQVAAMPAGGASIGAAFLAVSLGSQLILAAVAARRMAEARSTGTLELLLSSPLPRREIVLGHWWGLWRMIRWPLLVSTLLLLAFDPITRGSIFFYSNNSWSLGIYHISSTIANAVKMVAVCWMAMWMGVRCSSAARAVGFTLLWTMLVPYLMQSLMGLTLSLWLPALGFSASFLILPFVRLGYMIGVIFWARRQLLTRFQDAISG